MADSTPITVAAPGIRTRLSSLFARQRAEVTEWLGVHFPDRHLRNFMAWARKRYPDRSGAKSVVLVSEYNWYPSIYIYAVVLNHFCDRFGARIETYDFSRHPTRLLEKLYASIGAKKALHIRAREDEASNQREARQIFDHLQTKWDVLNISIGGMPVGDLIYDSYLRTHCLATVDLKDPRLLKMIELSVRIHRASLKYFEKNTVQAVIPDHTAYVKCGILVRMALMRGIPVYLLPYRLGFFVLRVDPQLSQNMPNVTKRWSYYRYPEIFAGLPQEEQIEGRARAGADLSARLSGKIDARLSAQVSAYAGGTKDRILSTSSKPKVLVLLHDFCDTVHCYRHMLFPDFYEWSHHLLARAGETDFEWYVKPHPHSVTDQRKNVTNTAVMEELKLKYPYITVLDRSVSNAQLVEEGICAMFTNHGTAGHEFAYMGVPAVNAGDNLHIAYDFNYHPKTVEEYDDLIARAGSLDRSRIRREDIEEFYYMQFFYFVENKLSEVNPIDLEWSKAEDSVQRFRRPESLTHFVKQMTPERERKFLAYLDECLEAAPSAVSQN